MFFSDENISFGSAPTAEEKAAWAKLEGIAQEQFEKFWETVTHEQKEVLQKQYYPNSEKRRNKFKTYIIELHGMEYGEGYAEWLLENPKEFTKREFFQDAQAAYEGMYDMLLEVRMEDESN